MDDELPQPPKKKRKTAKKLSEGYLRNSAVYYLQRHPASVAHFLSVMDRKMKRSLREHPEQDIAKYATFLRETLVPELGRAGLLDDTLYARALTGSLQRRGLPKRAIAMKLSGKGLEADEEQLAEQDDFKAAYLFARRKRLGPFSKTAGMAAQAGIQQRETATKELAALARAGFSYDVAKRVLAGETPEV